MRSATCSARLSSKLSRIRSPRANLRSRAAPTPTARRPPPVRPLTPLIAKIEPPSSTRQRWRPPLDRRQPDRALLQCLAGDQTGVFALRLSHQLFMRAHLNGTTRAQHDDAIAIADGTQAVSNEQASASSSPEMVIDQGLGLGV